MSVYQLTSHRLFFCHAKLGGGVVLHNGNRILQIPGSRLPFRQMSLTSRRFHGSLAHFLARIRLASYVERLVHPVSKPVTAEGGRHGEVVRTSGIVGSVCIDGCGLCECEVTRMVSKIAMFIQTSTSYEGVMKM